MTRRKFPDPPAHLSERSRELWSAIGPKEARSVGRRTLFQTALEALDSADSARRIIAAEGLIVRTGKSGVAHLHPAAKAEKESRAAFMSAWHQLDLHWPEDGEG